MVVLRVEDLKTREEGKKGVRGMFEPLDPLRWTRSSTKRPPPTVVEDQRQTPGCRDLHSSESMTDKQQSSSSSFTFPAGFTDRMWRSMRLSPKKLACEKEFYLRDLRAAKKARIVWKCVETQPGNGKNGKNSKSKAKQQQGSTEASESDKAASGPRTASERSRCKRKLLEAFAPDGATVWQRDSGNTAASNTNQNSRQASPFKEQSKARRPSPGASGQSNSIHKWMSNSSVTLEHGSSKPERKGSGGSSNLSALGSVALSQNKDKKKGNDCRMGRIGGDRSPKSPTSSKLKRKGSVSSEKGSAGECRKNSVERCAMTVKPLGRRNSSLSASPSKDLRQNSTKSEELMRLNDEALAMQLHHQMNAPSLRSRARRSMSIPSGSRVLSDVDSAFMRSCGAATIDHGGLRLAEDAEYVP